MISFLVLNRENLHLHLERIIEIENLSFSSPWSRNGFLQETRNPVTRFWALMVEDFLSGYICFWMFDNEIQVINIAVHPAQRGKGIGRHLLTRMIETGISKGIRNIWLDVRLSNLTARRLYEGMGFEGVGRRKEYYKDTNEDAIVMSLSLLQKEGHERISN